MIANGTETFQFESGMIVESWSLFGPLIEMKRLTSFEANKEPPRRRRTFLQRLFGRGKNTAPSREEPA
jgi:hypothetical protein